MKTFATRGLACIVMMTVIGSSWAAAKDPAATFRSASLAGYAVKREAFRTNNAELLKNQFYDKDALILGEGFAIIGGEAIYQGYKKLLPTRKDIQIMPVRSAVSRDGTLAYELTHVQPTAADPAQQLPEQTILFVWRKSDTGWRVAVEMAVKGTQNIPPLP